METLVEIKATARKQAFAARKAAHAEGRAEKAEAAADHVIAALGPLAVGTVVAGYSPIRTEIDPLPALARLAEAGARIALPVIAGAGLPLDFREWQPGAPLVDGPFGAA
ncbi:MAG: 5-formyltetrahydrofolate cyclo-ligase, partial [Pseudomonadota bacterium]